MYFMTVYFSSVSLLLLSINYYFLFLSMLIYGVPYHQCLLNKCQEESSETGINRRYKNSHLIAVNIPVFSTRDDKLHSFNCGHDLCSADVKSCQIKALN